MHGISFTRSRRCRIVKHVQQKMLGTAIGRYDPRTMRDRLRTPVERQPPPPSSWGSAGYTSQVRGSAVGGHTAPNREGGGATCGTKWRRTMPAANGLRFCSSQSMPRLAMKDHNFTDCDGDNALIATIIVMCTY